MAKRKATNAFIAEESPTKRVTRSSGALSVTQPVANAQSPTKKRRGRPPGIPANAVRKGHPVPMYGRKGARPRSPTTSSLKENERCDDEKDSEDEQGEEADELNISSEKELPSGSCTSARRVVLDSVMISTPRRIKPATRHTTTSNRPKPVALASQESPEHSDEPDSTSVSPIPETSTVASPSKTSLGKRPQVMLPKHLPIHLASSLSSQKQACLAALHDPPFPPEGEADDDVNTTALNQLTDLIRGTVERGEGNSCLVLGPAGSGKSRVNHYSIVQVRDSSVILRFLRRPCQSFKARAS